MTKQSFVIGESFSVLSRAAASAVLQFSIARYLLYLCLEIPLDAEMLRFAPA